MKALFFFTMLIAFSGLGCSHSRKSTQLKDILVPPTVKSPVTTGTDSSRNRDQVLKNKYSQYLRTVSDSIVNLRLYTFIDKWMNTPYRWGGTNHNGIDCSAFIQLLLAEVYTISIPRTSVQQLFAKNIEPFGGKHYLAEGDLLFFRTMRGKIVSHVGLYLANNMFISASSADGVSIDDLNSTYWKKKFVTAGRVKASASSKN